eukprot:tig00000692_g3220.t1
MASAVEVALFDGDVGRGGGRGFSEGWPPTPSESPTPERGSWASLPVRRGSAHVSSLLVPEEDGAPLLAAGVPVRRAASIGAFGGHGAGPLGSPQEAGWPGTPPAAQARSSHEARRLFFPDSPQRPAPSLRSLPSPARPSPALGAWYGFCGDGSDEEHEEERGFEEGGRPGSARSSLPPPRLLPPLPSPPLPLLDALPSARLSALGLATPPPTPQGGARSRRGSGPGGGRGSTQACAAVAVSAPRGRPLQRVDTDPGALSALDRPASPALGPGPARLLLPPLLGPLPGRGPSGLARGEAGAGAATLRRVATVGAALELLGPSPSSAPPPPRAPAPSSPRPAAPRPTPLCVPAIVDPASPAALQQQVSAGRAPRDRPGAPPRAAPAPAGSGAGEGLYTLEFCFLG